MRIAQFKDGRRVSVSEMADSKAYIELEFEYQYWEIIKQNEMVVFYFYVSFCKGGRSITKMFEKLTTKYGDKIYFVKIDGVEIKELDYYGEVTMFPSLVFYKNGKKIKYLDYYNLDKTIPTIKEFLSL